VIAVHRLRCAATTGSEGDLRVVEVDGGQLGNTIDASGLGQPALPQLVIRGGRGPDRIVGGSAGTDAATFFPAGGTDSVDGGTAGGTVDFAGVRRSVDVDLAHHTAHGPGGLIVGLRRVESVVGSDGGGRLVGDAAANALCGGRGRNVIDGGGGDDVLGSIGPAELVAGTGRSLLGACGRLDDPVPVASAGPVGLRCSGPADAVDLGGGDTPSRADWTIGSRCTRVLGLRTLDDARPMRLTLDARDPRHDAVVLPLDGFYRPRRFVATLTAPDRIRLGAVAQPPGRTAADLTLRISRSGADYLSRRRPLTATLRIAESGCPGGCDGATDAVGLRLGRPLPRPIRRVRTGERRAGGRRLRRRSRPRSAPGGADRRQGHPRDVGGPTTAESLVLDPACSSPASVPTRAGRSGFRRSSAGSAA
jgi:Ca2+-binding RTX toxin-like protein